ncbi:MAG: Fic family protein [Lachnospiraceae bacterium]|nr:Fic family protein [Lachnospiraceae bacterium]
MRNFDYTKLANYKWDSEVLSYVAKIHECKGRQDLFVRQKPIELDRLIEVAKIQSTEASNKIEGIVTTSTRIRQLVEEKTTPRNRDESEILGYRDVLNTIHESHDYIPVTPSYILQLHRDLLKHAGLSYGGNFKNAQNYISETRPDGTQIVRFTPLAPYETPEAVEKICESYKRALNTEAVDALILIPAFICDFLCIHPFNDGNGRMSRLLTLLLLYQNGYEVGKYISIEKQIEKTKDAYYDMLTQSDIGWHEETNDSTPFIKYMLQMVLACYVEFEERVGMMNGKGRGSTAYDIVKAYMMDRIGKMTGAEVIAACPSVGRSAALGAIKKLTEEGLILKCGSGRATYYVRADAVQE